MSDIEFTEDGVFIDGKRVDINDEGFGELAFGKGAVRLYDARGNGVGWATPETLYGHSFWKKWGPLIGIVVVVVVIGIAILIGAR